MTTNTDVKFVPNGEFDRFFNEPTGEVGVWLHKKGLRIIELARLLINSKTGELAGSLHIMHNRNARGQMLQVGSSVKYAYYYHEGTKPHVIRANKQEFLRFRTHGRYIVTKQVNHPGTKPKKFLTIPLRVVIR